MKKIIYILMLFITCVCLIGCSTNTTTNNQENKELKICLECIDYWLIADNNGYYFDYDKITEFFWQLHPNATIVDYEFVISTNRSFWWNTNNGDAQIIVIKYYE